jgi:glycosyltransferase involved in cell wall biosynthesis
MRVLHINTLRDGGAAWCVFRLSKALAREGVESRVLIAEGEAMPEGVEGEIAVKDRSIWNTNRYLRSIKKRLSRLGWWMEDYEKMEKRFNKLNTARIWPHQPLSQYKNIAHHPLVEWADVIHLHWVAGFVDYPTFFEEVRKPVVWTLHDKYPAEGVQHYSSDYFPVPEEMRDLDSLCRRIKRRGMEKAFNLNLVAVSATMLDVCRQSDVLRGFPVTLIHNGVDIDVYRPCDKQAARKELGFDREACIFLFSSYYIHDRNKGLDRIVRALEKTEIPNKVLVCVGMFLNELIPTSSFPIVIAGLLGSQSKMAGYYAAADYFVQCSYEESFGQTVIEAMSCGTPVVSTPCGISPELIRPSNGVICKGYDSDAIAAGIAEALKHRYDGEAIRQYISARYSYDLIAKQYIEQYRKVQETVHT